MNFFTYRPLTELEFLSRQTLVNVQGLRTSSGVITSRVTASGLTFVLVGAKVSSSFLGTGEGDVRIQLRINGTVLETGLLSATSSTASSVYQFVTKGPIMIGDGVISIDLNATNVSSGNINLAGTIFGYERNT